MCVSKGEREAGREEEHACACTHTRTHTLVLTPTHELTRAHKYTHIYWKSTRL